MNSYEENKMRKDGAKIQFCTVFALCAKTAQDFLRKLVKACAIHKAQSFALCSHYKATLRL
jgi:hypothetical protein